MIKKYLFFFWMQLLLAGTIQQTMQLQLADASGLPVPNTEFLITVEIIKNQNQVT